MVRIFILERDIQNQVLRKLTLGLPDFGFLLGFVLVEAGHLLLHLHLQILSSLFAILQLLEPLLSGLPLLLFSLHHVLKLLCNP